MWLSGQQTTMLNGFLGRFLLVDHPEPRYSVFADAEAQSTLVWVTYKHDRKEVVCDSPLHPLSHGPLQVTKGMLWEIHVIVCLICHADCLSAIIRF